jgi:hypothetical protein
MADITIAEPAAGAELLRARTRLLRAWIKAGTARTEALRAESAALRAEAEAFRIEGNVMALLAGVLRDLGNEGPDITMTEAIAMLPAAEREAFGELYDEVQTLIGERAAA